MNKISRKPARTVTELASAHQHQKNWLTIMERAVEGNSHWTKVLGLGRPGLHGGARAGIALLPTSRGPRSQVVLAFLWSEGRLRSSDVNGYSLDMPDDKAARTFTSDTRGREVARPERPVHDDDGLHNKKSAQAVPLASARQRPENQKETQAQRPVQTLPHGQRVC